MVPYRVEQHCNGISFPVESRGRVPLCAAFRPCLRFGADAHAASLHDGKPLLFFASAAGALDILTTLLGPSRADPNVRCHDGTTALHFAAAHGQARPTPMCHPTDCHRAPPH